MGWMSFSDDRGGRWKLNRDGLWMMTRQNVYHRAVLSRSTVKRESHWFGPDVASVEIDFCGIRSEVDQESRMLYLDLEAQVASSPMTVLSRLVDMREETESAAGTLLDLQRRTSKETMRNIERSVSRAETAVEIAKGVRD